LTHGHHPADFDPLVGEPHRVLATWMEVGAVHFACPAATATVADPTGEFRP